MQWNEIISENKVWPIKTYLEANCLALGMVIHSELGWPLVLLSFGDMPYHVVARNPHGGFADIRGPSLSEAQVLQGCKPLVPSWKPSFRDVTASEVSELFDKRPSPELLKQAHSDLIHYWGADVLAELKGS